MSTLVASVKEVEEGRRWWRAYTHLELYEAPASRRALRCELEEGARSGYLRARGESIMAGGCQALPLPSAQNVLDM